MPNCRKHSARRLRAESFRLTSAVRAPAFLMGEGARAVAKAFSMVGKCVRNESLFWPAIWHLKRPERAIQTSTKVPLLQLHSGVIGGKSMNLLQVERVPAD